MRTLVTERLLLRPWREEDYLDLYEYAKNPLVGPSAGWLPHKSAEESRNAIKRFNHASSGCDTRAIILQKEARAIGSIGLHHRSPQPTAGLVERELGYVLNPKYWGQGIMPEAVEAVLEDAFLQMGVELIWCGHYAFNTSSKRVIEKSGFIYQFSQDEIRYQVDGKRLLSLFYSLDKETFLKTRALMQAEYAFRSETQIEGV